MPHKRSFDDYRQHQDERLPKTPKQNHGANPQGRNYNEHNPQRNITTAAQALATLQSKYPPTTTHAPIPGYTTTQLLPFPSTSSTNPIYTEDNLPLPPLPPLPNTGYLSTAPFTHPSVADDKRGLNPSSAATAPLNYERLEFLGDAYLELIASRLIYTHFPFLPTGRQSQLREKLIKNSTLSSFARAYNFRARIHYSSSANTDFRETGARHANGIGTFTGGWEKVEADVFEAYVAAVVLADPVNGFKTVEEWLQGCWAGILLREGPEAVVNKKEELQKLIATREVKIEYLDEPCDTQSGSRGFGASGTSLEGDYVTQQTFQVGVYITIAPSETRQRIGFSTGLGKKEAGMKAAGDALVRNKELIGELAVRKQREADERRILKEARERAAVGGGEEKKGKNAGE